MENTLCYCTWGFSCQWLVAGREVTLVLVVGTGGFQVFLTLEKRGAASPSITKRDAAPRSINCRRQRETAESWYDRFTFEAPHRATRCAASPGAKQKRYSIPGERRLSRWLYTHPRTLVEVAKHRSGNREIVFAGFIYTLAKINWYNVPSLPLPVP